jgi:hypothetical protein
VEAEAWINRHVRRVSGARALFREINDDATWNPWVTEDRAKDLERAMDVMDQWRRAEPNHRYLTKTQLDARFAASSRSVRAQFAADDRRRENDRERYDPDRAAARLALLERESRLE